MMTKLQAMRKAKGMKQREVAQKLDITKQGFSLIERGERKLKADMAVELAKIYGVTVEELVS